MGLLIRACFSLFRGRFRGFVLSCFCDFVSLIVVIMLTILCVFMVLLWFWFLLVLVLICLLVELLACRFSCGFGFARYLRFLV